MTRIEGAYGERQPRPLRVLVIAEKDPFNSHVLHALAGVCDVQQVLTSAPAPTRSGLSRLKQLGTSPSAMSRFARSRALRLIDKMLDRRTAGMLTESEFWPEQAALISPADLRGDRMRAILATLQPDLLVLSGAPILPPHVFSAPRLGTINIHCGIANRYRGNHCILFPLLKQEYDAIGSTLHYVDEGIDTGALLAHGRPSVDASESLASVLAKASRISAVMLTEFIAALEQGPIPGLKSVERGVLIRDRDRRVWHYIYLSLRRRFASSRPRRPSREEISRYYRAGAGSAPALQPTSSASA